MTLTVIINLVVCVCALVGFIMGVHTYFKPRQPLYSQMVTIALGCAALGRLYNAAAIVCGGEIPRTFNTGVLATIGCFMFFFSANYGQMDSLCDMGEKSNRKIRWIALLAPLVLLGAAVLVIFVARWRIFFPPELISLLRLSMLRQRIRGANATSLTAASVGGISLTLLRDALIHHHS